MYTSFNIKTNLLCCIQVIHHAGFQSILSSHCNIIPLSIQKELPYMDSSTCHKNLKPIIMYSSHLMIQGTPKTSITNMVLIILTLLNITISHNLDMKRLMIMGSSTSENVHHIKSLVTMISLKHLMNTLINQPSWLSKYNWTMSSYPQSLTPTQDS